MAALLTGGCETSPAVERQLELRREKIARPIEIWGRVEETRLDKMWDSIDFIPFNEQRHVERLRQTPYRVEAWIERDVDRVRERRYFEEMWRLYLEGDVEGMEKPAVTLFL